MDREIFNDFTNDSDKDISAKEAVKKAFEKSIWCVNARCSSLSFDNLI